VCVYTHSFTSEYASYSGKCTVQYVFNNTMFTAPHNVGG